MKSKGRKKKSFFKRQDWFLSAGLVFITYILLVIGVYVYNKERSGIQNIIHAMPLIAAGMIILGVSEKKRMEKLDREIKMKRYKVRMELSRIERESGHKVEEDRSRENDPEKNRRDSPDKLLFTWDD